MTSFDPHIQLHLVGKDFVVLSSIQAVLVWNINDLRR